MELTVNKEGFVFDPSGGEMFTINTTGLRILEGLKKQKSIVVIARELSRLFAVTLEQVERDIFDFMSQLRAFHLL
jgi:hypothetical protein